MANSGMSGGGLEEELGLDRSSYEPLDESQTAGFYSMNEGATSHHNQNNHNNHRMGQSNTSLGAEEV
jgi:hypothetical protein